MKIVIHRDRELGVWVATRIASDTAAAITAVTGHPVTERAGNVAAAIALANPGATVGIRSFDIGLATAKAYGSVVWLQPDYGTNQ